MRCVFEVERDGPSLLIWEGGISSKVIFPSETLAMLQEQRLQADEKRFHISKAETGVYTIDSFGEVVGPVEYIRLNFKFWRSKAARPLNIIIMENYSTRAAVDYW